MPRPDHEDDDYFLPLEDQRVFGAGIKRKRIPFVRASEDLQTTSAPPSNEPVHSVADQYLAIVMSKKKPKRDTEATKEHKSEDTFVSNVRSTSAPVPSVAPSESNIDGETKADTHVEVTGPPHTDLCEVCKLPVSATDGGAKADPDEVDTTSSTTARTTTLHEASIVHQVCLQHSHPPSHLDRTRHGLRYLASYGWDPDSRTGLGAEGRTGILQPIKPKAKTTTSGLGISAEDEEVAIAAKKNLRKRQQEQRQKLNAKQVRLGQIADKKKGEKLREMFYASDDIQRYLGGA